MIWEIGIREKLYTTNLHIKHRLTGRESFLPGVVGKLLETSEKMKDFMQLPIV